jgi:hypothetical protein
MIFNDAIHVQTKEKMVIPKILAPQNDATPSSLLDSR